MQPPVALLESVGVSTEPSSRGPPRGCEGSFCGRVHGNVHYTGNGLVEDRGQQIMDGGRHRCAEGQRARAKGRQPQLKSLLFLFLPFIDMKNVLEQVAHKKRAVQKSRGSEQIYTTHHVYADVESE